MSEPKPIRETIHRVRKLEQAIDAKLAQPIAEEEPIQNK